MTGQLDVLSCGGGHVELKFDKSNPIEMERARRAVAALLRSGCILFVEVDGKLERVLQFDATNDTYIVSDVPEGDSSSGNHTADETKAKAKESKSIPHTDGRRRKRTVDATTAKATSVPMRSGG